MGETLQLTGWAIQFVTEGFSPRLFLTILKSWRFIEIEYRCIHILIFLDQCGLIIFDTDLT
jgi:hypothetical protein